MKKRFGFILTQATVLVLLGAVLLQACSKDDSDDQKPDNEVLFEDAFDSIGTFPEVHEMIFVTQEGQLMRSDVFPGQIIIRSNGATADQIRNLVVKNGGRIGAQLPAAGMYVVLIDPAKTSVFLNVMYENLLVSMAFPNRPSVARKAERSAVVLQTAVDAAMKTAATKSVGVSFSTDGDAGSIIQTIDLETGVDCGSVTHLAAVAAVAAKTGVSVNTYAVPVNADGFSDFNAPFKKLAELIKYSYKNKKPIVINISMGGRDTIPGEPELFYQCVCETLEQLEIDQPGILENAVVTVALTNNHVNETQSINTLINMDPSAAFWRHLYFVGGQSGAAGCTGGGGTGYAAMGTTSYLAGPSCDQDIPGTSCNLTGNSFSTPAVSGTLAATYELLKQEGETVLLPDIAEKLFEYQNLYSGQLPTPEQLRDYVKGIVPAGLYDGTWHCTFYYTASVPQEEGPDLIVNTSFTIDFTIKSEVSVPGYPQLLRFQAITCSDPRFGAIMAITPNSQLSMAILPASYGSQSEPGQGLIIEFPNGSTIMTNNNIAGAFTVNPQGNVIASSALVEDDAYLAATNIGDSNNPMSGPGQYAYNWCTFRQWRMEKVK